MPPVIFMQIIGGSFENCIFNVFVIVSLLLPIAGILYKYIGRSSSLGILTMFIAITIGYGTGLIYNYQAYQLGDITEVATSSIVSGYNYELLSNIFVLIASNKTLSICFY